MPLELAQLRALYDEDERRNVEYPRTRREVTPPVVRLVDPDGVGSFVIYSNLSAENVETAIRDQIAYFTEQGQDFEWKVYDYDSPSDLRERLLAYGFEAEEPEAIMVLELTETPVALLQPVGYTVRRITDPDDLHEVAAIEEAVWEIDWSQHTHRLAGELQDDPEFLSVYVAYVDGVPASAAWINFSRRGRFASLWGGSTLPAYRKRGLYTALLAVRTQEAIRRGFQFLTIDASPMSRPIVERFGFRFIAYAYALRWYVQPTE
jgi:GNAT superfamily N-acetyltransferase